MTDREALYKYYDAIRTGDPDRQIADGLDLKAIEYAIACIAYMDILVETFSHYHVGPDDQCGKCGLDIRCSIHKRSIT